MKSFSDHVSTLGFFWWVHETTMGIVPFRKQCFWGRPNILSVSSKKKQQNLSSTSTIKIMNIRLVEFSCYQQMNARFAKFPKSWPESLKMFELPWVDNDQSNSLRAWSVFTLHKHQCWFKAMWFNKRGHQISHLDNYCMFWICFRHGDTQEGSYISYRYTLPRCCFFVQAGGQFDPSTRSAPWRRFQKSVKPEWFQKERVIFVGFITYMICPSFFINKYIYIYIQYIFVSNHTFPGDSKCHRHSSFRKHRRGMGGEVLPSFRFGPLTWK